MAERLTEQEGRQGRRGRPALVVLVVSSTLMGIALAGLMIWIGSTSPRNYASRGQDASRRSITGSAQRSNAPSPTNSERVPGGNPADPTTAVPRAGDR